MSIQKSPLSIFIDDGGSGSVPVVFIHSLGGNSQQWAAQLRHLRETRRAIALDLRGHGQSPLSLDDSYAIAAMAEDVQTVVERLGIEKFVLTGHSMGGSVAVAYAGTYPRRVAGLLLVDPSGDSTQIPAAEIEPFLGAIASDAYSNVIEGYWHQILAGSTPATQTTVMQDLRNTPKETVVNSLKQLFKYNPGPALRRYDGPKLSVITPLNETPFSLHKLAPDLPHQIINGTGHWLHLDKPEAFNQILDNFLASIDNHN